MLGVEPSVLRFWEKKFPALQPKTTGRNVRQYTKENIELAKQIHNLVRVRGFRLEAARKMLSANRGAVEKQTKVLELLVGIRDELQAIREMM